jgi:hypothetical protein
MVIISGRLGTWDGMQTKVIVQRSVNSSSNIKLKQNLNRKQRFILSLKWLHMIAHRFEPNTGDRFSNLVCFKVDILVLPFC